MNAFTRSKVLQVWAFLCERDAIPTKAQPAVVQLATVRLEDKSGQVVPALALARLILLKTGTNEDGNKEQASQDA